MCRDLQALVCRVYYLPKRRISARFAEYIFNFS